MGNELKLKPVNPVAPGDLLSAAGFNDTQVKLQQFALDAIDNALATVDEVSLAADSNKLNGQTLAQITQEIINQTLKAIPKASGGYESVFLRLELGEERIIEHGLGAFPLTDVYQLKYFPAICTTGERGAEEEVRFVHFYLYNSKEAGTMRRRSPRGKPQLIELEEPEAYHARLKLADLLQFYDVSYTESTDLEELVENFWDAFLQRQTTDDFDPAQYGSSPWFEKHGEGQTSVTDLKARGDWDRLYLKMLPEKTVNALHKGAGRPARPAEAEPQMHTGAHNQIQVVHYDWETIGIRLIEKPVYSSIFLEGFKQANTWVCRPLPKEFLEELKVMVLMKV